MSTVFFLGAGASADAGVPLTNRLLARVYDRIRCRPGRAKLVRFIEGLGFLAGRSTRPPIVDAISMLDSCIRAEQPLGRRFTIEELRAVRRTLVIELSEVIENTDRGAALRVPEDAWDQPGAKGRRVPRYYQRFARVIRPAELGSTQQFRYDLPGGDTVITTNYDINMDVALYEQVYWEEAGGQPGFATISDVFLGSTFRDPYEDIDAFSNPRAVAKLFKLHGSLNWLYCPHCSRIYVAAFGSSVRLLTRRGKNRDWERTCHCGYFGLEPVVIAPSAYQEIANAHLQSIWHRSYFALESAAVWVFAGYSLPSEDVAVRSLLHRAFETQRYQGRRPEIHVVGIPDGFADLRRRYLGLFGDPIVSHESPFKEYVRFLTSQTASA